MAIHSEVGEDSFTMGLIKNIFGAIVGVIKAFFGIFGLGKKSEYFLEADNRESRSKPQAQPQAER